MKRQQRYTITAQLVSGKDEDLIMWLTSLSAGQRNPTIKALLRRALALPQPSAPVEVDPADFNAIIEQINMQQQHIANLSAEVERLRQQIANGVIVSPAAAQSSALGTVPTDDPALQRRADRLKRQNW